MSSFLFDKIHCPLIETTAMATFTEEELFRKGREAFIVWK